MKIINIIDKILCYSRREANAKGINLDIKYSSEHVKIEFTKDGRESVFEYETKYPANEEKIVDTLKKCIDEVYFSHSFKLKEEIKNGER